VGEASPPERSRSARWSCQRHRWSRGDRPDAAVVNLHFISTPRKPPDKCKAASQGDREGRDTGEPGRAGGDDRSARPESAGRRRGWCWCFSGTPGEPYRKGRTLSGALQPILLSPALPCRCGIRQSAQHCNLSRNQANDRPGCSRSVRSHPGTPLPPWHRPPDAFWQPPLPEALLSRSPARTPLAFRIPLHRPRQRR
jgi:hypothetical protein